MSLRFVSRVANVLIRVSGIIKCHATNPKYIVQHRTTSNKNDGNCKKKCGSQFFEGCSKKGEKIKCPETKVKRRGIYPNSCKKSPCKEP